MAKPVTYMVTLPQTLGLRTPEETHRVMLTPRVPIGRAETRTGLRGVDTSSLPSGHLFNQGFPPRLCDLPIFSLPLL